ncbi:MAG TPA: helix-turn-helix domain-containing protein [Actinomycetes bacterium]|jgi:predicted transcriptional regulator|nr:helix-turn-helix domain-containing protein [Actinomycetes bacterium]
MQSPTGESDLVDRLVRHGLGQGEARCYVGMLAPRAFKVSEVAASSGLPRSRAYELIRSLVRSGLCTEVAGGGAARFRAVPPNEAIGRLEAFMAEQARRRNAALTGVLHALHLRDGLPAGSEREPVDLLRRRDQVYGSYERAVRDAREEIVSVAPATWDPAVQFPVMAERLAAGVRFRTIHDRAVLASESYRAALAFHHARGFQARVLDRVDILFSLIDRRTVFLNLTGNAGNANSAAGMESLQIHHAGLGQTLHEAFERLWERAVPIDAAHQGDGLLAAARPTDGRSADPG